MCARSNRSGRLPEPGRPSLARPSSKEAYLSFLCLRTKVASAFFNASFCGVSSSDSVSDSNAEIAFPGKVSVFCGGVFSAILPTCTLIRITVTCHPRLSNASCSFGNCCLSFAARAALGVATTSWSFSNERTEQASKSAGRIAEQSFCNAMRRATAGKSVAIRSFARRKSVTAVTLLPGFRMLRLDCDRCCEVINEDGRSMLKPYHIAPAMDESEEW